MKQCIFIIAAIFTHLLFSLHEMYENYVAISISFEFNYAGATVYFLVLFVVLLLQYDLCFYE